MRLNSAKLCRDFTRLCTGFSRQPSFRNSKAYTGVTDDNAIQVALLVDLNLITGMNILSSEDAVVDRQIGIRGGPTSVGKSIVSPRESLSGDLRRHLHY